VTDVPYDPDEELPRDTAPEAVESENVGAPATGALHKTVSVAAGAARGSAALAGGVYRVTYWPAALCVLGAIALQVRLPAKLTIGPSWLLPSLEGALLIGLAATTPWGRADEEHPARRRIAIGLIAFVNIANAVDLYLLAHELLTKHISNGHALILSGIAIWLTNVLIFALWYWQLDGGQPYTPHGWMPSFIDYLALSLTTATAFSPTDTMPNSNLAKVLMSVQGLISLTTLGLIISRAVGILT